LPVGGLRSGFQKAVCQDRSHIRSVSAR
jgi:hypothetical protein